MRQRFEAQMTLGSTPIERIQIPTKSRDEFPPFLRALQYVYCDKDLSERVFSLIEAHVCKGKRTGRLGMNLWSIFVLAGARLCLNTDYDRLHYLANNDTLLRQMLGVHDGIVRGRDFEMQTIKDNVQLLDDEVLRQINTLIVEAGHRLLKKKETEALHIKVDSFVTEANIHFPTDYNLLWDSGRKCLDVLGYLMESNPYFIQGWRKKKSWLRDLKNQMLRLSRATVDKSKNREQRIQKEATEYLRLARGLMAKLYPLLGFSTTNQKESTLLLDLFYFMQMLEKHIDLVDRRLLKGEQIPHREKIFSVFEPWVEWISKGKRHQPVELGKRTNIATDQYHFIVDYWVADQQQDVDLLLPALDRIRLNFVVDSCSADKGYFSKSNIENLESHGIQSFISKKGKKNLADIDKEQTPEFIKNKRKHSAVESNINELEHRGLNRCPDRTLKRFHKYVGLGVIAYNLRRIGKVLLEADRNKQVQLKRAA